MVESLENIKQKEWLVTNGLGGYASSTVSGMNTRRYHGLLIASFNPPTARKVLVSKIEETLGVNGQTIPLSTNQYPGVIHPDGYHYLENFERDPLPCSTFKSDNWELKKTVFMPYGSNTTLVAYANTGKEDIQLQLCPLLVDRDYHGTFHQDDYFDFYFTSEGDGFRVHSHYGATPLFFKFTKGFWEEKREWFKNIEYDVEQFRGLDFQEDAYAIGVLNCTLSKGETVFMMFTTDRDMLSQEPEKLKQTEVSRLSKLVPKGVDRKFYQDLIRSADQFIVKRTSTDSFSVIAGYPWFTDWGRDTMISLLGLTIALSRRKESKSILNTFIKYLDKGMLPNRFPDYDGDPPEYNTIDATLWLFIAIYEYDQMFEDEPFLKSVFPKLEKVIQQHMKGTRYQIHVTAEGFLFGGSKNTQLTWMDARIGDYAVTPRYGCPVEINALWYNALKIYEYIGGRLGIECKEGILEITTKLEKAFRPRFYNEQGYLNDIVFEDGTADDTLRPNQLYVISLPFPLLNKKEEKSVLGWVSKELLTPLGLRTLNKAHPDFRPEYYGNQWLRDTAYHQGTVWPFLMSEYWLAYLKVYAYSAKAKKEVLSMVEDFKKHFYEDACIQGISEIFDGDEPEHGKGCINQAWSVSALLRVLVKADLLTAN